MRMRKCQWVHMALLVLCTAIPMHGWALGLGEIDVESALNERLAGTIKVLDSQGYQASEIVVSMASREDFERVGVERFFYLTNIKFDVELGADGATVKVRSTQPIAEPYLNFIVEVLWPNGRLLKEYTILLDPPTFSQAAAPAVSAPNRSVAQAPSSAAQPRQARPGTQVDLRPSRPAAPRRQLPGDGVMTNREDTLWKIASRTLPSANVTINQQMLAIQRKNPQAFLRNNINLLKAGYVLDIPTESEALSVNQQAANNDVAAQTEDWRSGSTREQVASSATQLVDDTADTSVSELRSQVDATAKSQTQSKASSQGEGQVRIVANSGDLASGTASGDDPTINQLIEEKENLTRQVDELSYQLDREKDIAVNQVSVKDRQLEVKNQEIAQLQEQMKEVREQMAAAAKNQNQNANPPAAEPTPWWQSPLLLFGVIGALILILAYALITLRRAKADVNELYESYEPQADEPAFDVDNTVVAGAAVAETQYSDTSVEPTIGELDDLDDGFVIDDDGSDEGVPHFDGDDFAAEEPAYEEEPVVTAVDDISVGPEDHGETQTGDVIGEAEIYIAYGRYGQAANLLGGVLGSEPDRWDVRLKLLEVYVESHDEENFASHAQYMIDNCDDDDALLACQELEAQLGSGHVDLRAESASAEGDLGLADESAAPSDEDGFALELDELDVSLDEDTTAGDLGSAELDLDDSLDVSLDDAADVSEDIALDAGGTGDGLDFELEFDGEPEASDIGTDEGAADTVASESPDASAELGGDLGMDFDPDKSSADDVDEFNLDAVELADEDAPEPDGATTVVDDVDDFEFDTTGDADINATKLDLAEAYVDMGDADGAQDILKEVLEEGSPEQQQKAQEMLDTMAG